MDKVNWNDINVVNLKLINPFGFSLTVNEIGETTDYVV